MGRNVEGWVVLNMARFLKVRMSVFRVNASGKSGIVDCMSDIYILNEVVSNILKCRLPRDILRGRQCVCVRGCG